MSLGYIMDTTTKIEVIYAHDSQDIVPLEFLAGLGKGRAAQVHLVLDSRDGALYAEKAFKTRSGLLLAFHCSGGRSLNELEINRREFSLASKSMELHL